MDSPRGGNAPHLAESKPASRLKAMSNLQARLITGIIIALFTLAVTYCGGRAFQIFCLCVGAAVLHEWSAITKIYAKSGAVFCAWLCYGLLGAALLFAPVAAPAGGAVLAAFVFGVAASAFAAVSGGLKAALWRGGGFLYAALFPLSFACLRGGLGLGAAAGLYWALLLYVAVWASDVGAYMFGRCLGGPKLAPKISPNKTWSGACGGILCAIAAALCFAHFIGSDWQLLSPLAEKRGILNPKLVISAAFLLALIAQIGDLLESWFKRLFGVKDSGRLLPGHGGIMDRIDGLLPAAVIFVGFLALFYR